ncbi:uncharacterized protein LOC124939580 [Impatiens glandulifera]|uniref:uncharacterized protein LOC124939580 n=1 Tax=Impatiens glandulifera TaxID=253017 RepID=UPI001FB18B30|nr:uncharacterized protein LOC124939580 [Impatiens glandulifera]
MQRILAVMMGTIGNMKKTRRVADETILATAGNLVELPQGRRRRRHGYKGISVIFTIVLAPLSCLMSSTQPNGGGVDSVWASGDMGLMSEMNHLMVNDSMRYAILL